jgi:hypothetical protein
MAGPAIDLPSAALRSANLRLQGSGQGSVPAAAYRAELPSLVQEIDAGTFAVRPTAMPLAEVEPSGPAQTRQASAPYSCHSRDWGRCLGTGGVIRSVRAAL